MKYFLIETDKKASDLPQLIHWHDKVDFRDICVEKAYKIASRQLILVKSGPDLFYPDIISMPVFLMTKRAKKVVEMYAPGTVWKEMVLLDQENEKVSRYFMPVFEEVACLAEESVFNLDHSMLKKIVLNEDVVRNHSIFRIAGVKKQYIVGNLDVVESMLKRDMRGIGITELDVIREG
ncbi:MAG: hypothetical protein K2P64_08510 [Lachnospiraceae bacterium]|nr:hypothetical protein [Lachnospiraceae bacterium]